MPKSGRGAQLSGWSHTTAAAAVQCLGGAWSRARRRRRDMGLGIRYQAGFTLIELMVVIIILGLLAAIVMPRIVGETDKARYGAALAQMRILEDALKRYKLDNGIFPTTDQGLEALVRRPTSGVLPRGWPEGGYVDRQHRSSTITGIHSTVRYLQAHAALTKRIYRLMFDLDRQVLSVCYIDGEVCRLETSRELRAYALPADVRVLDVVSPQGTKTREGDAVTHFYPTGLAEPSIIHLGTD